MLGAKRPALLQGALLQVGRILKLNKKYIYIYLNFTDFLELALLILLLLVLIFLNKIVPKH